MNFEKIINNLEENIDKYIYMIKDGKTPVMLTAVHTVKQMKETGLKVSEPYTSAICQYVSEQTGCYFLIKSIDNGVDSNSTVEDEFKQLLLKKIKENNIKLLIDIHGAALHREFDVEFGTLKNLTIDINTQNTLRDCFIKNGITNIHYNDPFLGGGITKYIYENTDIDIVQIEVNHKFRDHKNIYECEKICNSLIEFVKTFSNYN
jgi:hypothetical protein